MQSSFALKSFDDWYNDLQAGWQCPVCTYINEPTRPGCSSCTAPRPDNYKIPDGYVLSEAERMRLASEQNLEEVSLLPFMACSELYAWSFLVQLTGELLSLGSDSDLAVDAFR